MAPCSHEYRAARFIALMGQTTRLKFSAGVTSRSADSRFRKTEYSLSSSSLENARINDFAYVSVPPTTPGSRYKRFNTTFIYQVRRTGAGLIALAAAFMAGVGAQRMRDIRSW